MPKLRTLASKVLALFGIRHRDEELREEIDAHIESLAAEHIRGGLSPDAARAAARREFGGIEQMKEAYRDRRGLSFMESLWQDIRLAARLLAKDRGFTLATVSVLALGLGATTTIFSVVNAGLLRDLPIDNADRIVSVGTHDTRRPHTFGPQEYAGVSYPELTDWRSTTRAFSGMEAFMDTSMNISGDEFAPEHLRGTFISAGTFELIGRSPIAGRPFSESDGRVGATHVALIGYETWQRRYGGDRSAIGRAIRVNSQPTVIVGVMPLGFQFPQNSEIWLPLAANPALVSQERQTRRLDVLARLAPGVDIRQAEAEMNAIAARLASDFPATNANVRVAMAPLANRFVPREVRLVFLALMGAVTAVLLVVCANVANLLLARSSQRAAEVSIRLSLGATRARIVRQLLVESLLLAALAGIAGFGVSRISLSLFSKIVVESLGAPPYWMQFTMDFRTYAFLTAVSLSTTVIVGLVPALHASRVQLNTLLKEGGRSISGALRARRWTAVLVTGQVALTMVLLSSSAYFGRAFLNMYRLDVGFDTSPLIRMRLDLRGDKYGTPGKRAVFAEQLDARLRAVPQMTAGITSNGPLAAGDPHELSIEGRGRNPNQPAPRVSVQTVGPRYFETIGLDLRRGRTFTDTDGGPGQESAIVNDRFAARHFPNANPLGARIRVSPPESKSADAPAWLTIVGVAPSLYQRQATAPDAVVYLPYRANAMHYVNMQVLLRRGDGTTEALISRVREEVRALDQDLPVFEAGTLDAWLAYQRSPQRVFGTMFTAFAGMALLLAGIGLYAVVSHSVTARTREIGVRVALGARRSHIHWLVMRRGLVQLGAGLILGLGGALGAGKLLDGVLGAQGNDLPALAVVTTVLIGVALSACIWPAQRAVRLDPTTALRCE